MYSVNLMGHIEKCVFDLGLKATEKYCMQQIMKA